MKRVTALVLTAFLLVGCGNDTDRESKPKETVTVTSEPTETESRGWDEPTEEPETETDISDQEFADEIRSELGLSESELPNDLVLGGAEEVCTMLDQDQSIDQILNYMVGTGFDGYSAGYFFGASVAVYCPEYIPMVDEYLGSGSNA